MVSMDGEVKTCLVVRKLHAMYMKLKFSFHTVFVGHFEC